MPIRHRTGKSSPVETGKAILDGDDKITTVFVEGTWSSLQLVDPQRHVPSGCTLIESNLSGDGRGFGKLTIRCKRDGQYSDISDRQRTTWRITMSEVTTDLKQHPQCVGGIIDIDRWLATDASKRFNGTSPRYVDADGTEHEITNASALRYINAYLKGVTTYVRYFPVVERISYYRTIPGCSTNGSSTVSGQAEFSRAGKWDVPKLRPSDYASSGWFKSGDSYQENNNRTWVRTEQWTWTPDGSGNQDTGWIYES